MCAGPGAWDCARPGRWCWWNRTRARYGHVHEGDAKEIVASLGGEPVARLDPHLGGYFEGQHHVVLENSGHIDPEKIEEYVARGGYEALVKALTDMNPGLGDRADHEKRAARDAGAAAIRRD